METIGHGSLDTSNSDTHLSNERLKHRKAWELGQEHSAKEKQDYDLNLRGWLCCVDRVYGRCPVKVHSGEGLD